MKFAIHHLSEYVPQTVAIAPNSSVTIGSSDAASMTVLDNLLAPEHFRLTATARKLRVENLSPSRPLSVNGRPVQSSELQNEQVISVGNSKFRVEAPEIGPDRIAEPTQPVFRYHTETVNGIIHATGTQDEAAKPLMDKLFELRQPLVIANFRAAERIDRLDEFAAYNDHLELAPEDIRMDNSIQVLPQFAKGKDGETANVRQIFEQLAPQDAATLVLCEKQRKTQDILSDLKLFLGWFRRPSVLQLFLQGPDEMFARKLVSPVEVIVICKPGEWHIYTLSEEIETLLQGIASESFKTASVS